MLFNSYLFILIFLPLSIAGYFLLNKCKSSTPALVYLFGMSLWFYGYNHIYYLAVILGSIVVNYGLYRAITAAREREKMGLAKTCMIVGVVLNLGVLGYFKYMDFFIQNINAIFKQDWAYLHILLPLGISFFTFQQVSFVVDSYKGEVPKYGFLHYACFVSYFPQLIAGPIVTHDELVPQFLDPEKRKFSMDNLAKGFYMFVLGLSKKVLLADIFNDAVIHGYATISSLNTEGAWITILSYTLQMYFDFSGYCDMAIGIAKMMNIDLPLNFDSPYRATSIADFWKRWHKTLTRFFTKYVYIPLGGSRHGMFRACLNTFIVFFLSGLWHGANWTFVVWGVMNGVALIIHRLTKKFWDRLHPALGWIITFVFFGISLTFFRADTIGDGWQIVKTAFSWNFGGLDKVFSDIFRTYELKKIASIINIEDYFPHFFITAYFGVAFFLLLGCKNAYEKMQEFKPTITKGVTTALLFIWCILSLSGLQVFLYFHF